MLVFVSLIRPEGKEAKEWFRTWEYFGTIASHEADECSVQIVSDGCDQVKLVARSLSSNAECIDDCDLKILRRRPLTGFQCSLIDFTDVKLFACGFTDLPDLQRVFHQRQELVRARIVQQRHFPELVCIG